VSLLESFTFAGAIVAFVNALFTAWDRLVRGRPQAWVDADKFGANPLECFRIKNPGPSDLLILEVRVDPPIYTVTKDRSVRATLHASAKRDWHVLLRAGDTCDLPIYPQPQADVSKNQRVRFFIYWRKTSSPLLPQVRVRHSTSTDYIQRIAAAAPRSQLIG